MRRRVFGRVLARDRRHDFQAEYTPARQSRRFMCILSARLGKASDRRILSRFEASATQLAADNRLTAIIAAYEQAADAALAEIVAETARALGAKH
jgi:ABC-type uncharacterized transport system auxiliary subunit